MFVAAVAVSSSQFAEFWEFDDAVPIIQAGVYAYGKTQIIADNWDGQPLSSGVRLVDTGGDNCDGAWLFYAKDKKTLLQGLVSNKGSIGIADGSIGMAQGSYSGNLGLRIKNRINKAATVVTTPISNLKTFYKDYGPVMKISGNRHYLERENTRNKGYAIMLWNSKLRSGGIATSLEGVRYLPVQGLTFGWLASCANHGKEVKPGKHRPRQTGTYIYDNTGTAGSGRSDF